MAATERQYEMLRKMKKESRPRKCRGDQKVAGSKTAGWRYGWWMVGCFDVRSFLAMSCNSSPASPERLAVPGQEGQRATTACAEH